MCCMFAHVHITVCAWHAIFVCMAHVYLNDCVYITLTEHDKSVKRYTFNQYIVDYACMVRITMQVC